MKNINNIMKNFMVLLKNSERIKFSFFLFFVALIMVQESAFSQNTTNTEQHEITGTVMDNLGNILPGVNVIIKGTTGGTQTDFNGIYSILTSTGDELTFSYLGLKSVTVTIVDDFIINITLEDDGSQLDEIVVIGYGTSRRKDISGSVFSVDMEDNLVSNNPSANVMQNLQGIVPGLAVGPQSSTGTIPEILIRGQNSINGSNEPLIVLDGIIYLGSLTDINPSDIARFDILKDASAAAAYGSRAANGVISITTKKGKIGKPLIKLTSTVGVNVWNNKFDMMNRKEWEPKYAVFFNQEVGSITFDDLTPTQQWEQGIDTDWMDLISRSGVIQDYQVSVSGATDKTNYYFSGGYHSEEGVIIGDEYERISLRMRMNTNITDWLKIGVDGSYNNNDYSGRSASLSSAFLNAPITYPYRFEGMPFNYDSNTSTLLERYPWGQSIQNPLWGTTDETVEDIDKSDFFRFAGNVDIKIPSIKGLSYRLNYSINAIYDTQDYFESELFHVGEASADNYFERYSTSQLQTHLSQANGSTTRRHRWSYVLDNILNYKRKFGDHYVDALLVATRDESYNKEVTLTGRDFSTNGNTLLGVNGLHKANIITSNLNVIEISNIGYLASLSYTFKDRYHFNGLVRRDGASVFGTDKKYGNFPTVGLAWTISKEDFLIDHNFIDHLKLKASYGQNGNQGITAYQSLSRAINGRDGNIQYEFGDDPSNPLFGIQIISLANPNLGWETTTSLNVGFESRFFNDRISLNVDYYSSETKDQIFLRNIPITNGFTSVLSSLGQVNNKGIEISLGTTNFSSDDFTWTTNLIYSRNRNELVELFGDDLDGDGREDDDISNSLFIGKSLGSIYGYKFIGVVQENDTDYIDKNGARPGDPKYLDINGDGFIDPDNDRKIIGVRKENFRMGLANNIRYKNFGLYVFVSGVFGGGKENFYVSENPLYNSFNPRGDTNDTNHPFWTPENQSNKFLSPIANLTRYSGIQSRGFVRIQDISLSYDMPKNIINKIGINSLNFFASVRNLHSFTDWYGGGDPEIGIRPLDEINPVPTTYSFGLKVNL